MSSKYKSALIKGKDKESSFSGYVVVLFQFFKSSIREIKFSVNQFVNIKGLKGKKLSFSDQSVNINVKNMRKLISAFKKVQSMLFSTISLWLNWVFKAELCFKIMN